MKCSLISDLNSVRRSISCDDNCFIISTSWKKGRCLWSAWKRNTLLQEIADYNPSIIYMSNVWMMRAVLTKSWRQHPTKQQLYSHLLPITKTIQIRRTRHAGHCWKSKDKLISDVLLWNPAHGRVKAVRPTRTYIQQLCVDTGCSLEDLPGAMDDRDGWRERVRC